MGPLRHLDARRDESGVALVVVIGVIVVATILTVAVSASLLDSGSRSAARSERVTVQGALEAGARAYARAVSIGEVTERTRFAMTQQAAAAVVPSGSVVVRDSHSSVAAKYRFQTGDGVHERVGTPVTSVTVHDFVDSSNVTQNEQFVVRTPIDSTTSTFWQVLRVDIPTSIVPGSTLAVYIRAWRGLNNGTAASRERVIRMELSAGYFSDYQMLVNSTVVFGGGATINGPIHSNGTSNTPGVNAGVHTVAKGAGSVNCSGDASVTTGTGSINLPAACAPAANTGNFVDFGRVSDSFTRMAADCSVSTTDGMYCYGASSQSYEAVLGTTSIVVRRGGSTIATIPTSSGKVIVLYFADDVAVRGSSEIRGRVTIAARHPVGASNRAANITITGNIHAPSSTPRRDVVGLMAEGHIIVDLPTPDPYNAANTCLATKWELEPPTSASQVHARTSPVQAPSRTIEAALIAATGGLRIPTEWTTFTTPFAPPYCHTINITGAIASHYAPVLEWQWQNFYKAGFEFRNYSWDSTLRENPPPYFPLTRTWETVSMKDANLDCLRGGSKANDWNCR